MRDKLVGIIVDRLRQNSSELTKQFQTPDEIQTRFAVLDDVLPTDIAGKIYESFPDVENMRLLSSFREKKYTSKSLEKMQALIADAIFAFQAPDVIREVELITGMTDLSGDPHLYAGGISSMVKGHFLNPHIDNSHDSERKLYRALNLLYYVTPNWTPDKGGSFELWDTSVKSGVVIPSLFNRLVIMETNSL